MSRVSIPGSQLNPFAQQGFPFRELGVRKAIKGNYYSFLSSHGKQPRTHIQPFSSHPPFLYFSTNNFLSTFTIKTDERSIADCTLRNEVKELSQENRVNAEVSLRFLVVLLSLCDFAIGSKNIPLI